MIKFERVDNRVRASIGVDVPNYEFRVLYFEWSCGGEMLAGFLSAELQQQMNDNLERIRREAYEQGWKDAKAKSVRRKYFRFGWR